MLMRRSIRIFILFAFAAAALFAADPFVGTWKLDSSKTKSSGNVTSLTAAAITFERQGEDYLVTVAATNADGSPTSIKYTVPINGGPAKVENGGGQFDAVTAKRMNAKERENTYSKDGKDIATRRLVVSKDGRTLTITFKGNDAQGNTVTSVQVFDKQ